MKKVIVSKDKYTETMKYAGAMQFAAPLYSQLIIMYLEGASRTDILDFIEKISAHFKEEYYDKLIELGIATEKELNEEGISIADIKENLIIQ